MPSLSYQRKRFNKFLEQRGAVTSYAHKSQPNGLAQFYLMGKKITFWLYGLDKNGNLWQIPGREPEYYVIEIEGGHRAVLDWGKLQDDTFYAMYIIMLARMMGADPRQAAINLGREEYLTSPYCADLFLAPKQ
jgi:hypothetical protein